MERPENNTINLFWYRRDLRVHDNTALIAALSKQRQVQPFFIFDKHILSDLDNTGDRRVSFIYNCIANLKYEFNKLGSDLWVFYGDPEQIIKQLLLDNKVAFIYSNTDYEPYARERDSKIKDLCQAFNVDFKTFKDQVIFEKLEVAKQNGLPYTVFTPYMRKWKQLYFDTKPHKQTAKPDFTNLNRKNGLTRLIELADFGFIKVNHQIKPPVVPFDIIENYHKNRDDLSIDGTSKLSVHLRFGTISIRQLVKIASEKNETYLNELIWREFYMQILWNFPHVVTHSFKKAYDSIRWNNSEYEFEKWSRGETGYAIVDAGMHQLLETGFMHNRVRMIVASFLCKHLLIDWRKGEAFFAKHLADYELSSNNGGWQWAASSGCDAVPYFRIFNPQLQTQKYDANGIYIKKWKGEQGLQVIIEHKYARERCLEVYKKALST